MDQKKRKQITRRSFLESLKELSSSTSSSAQKIGAEMTKAAQDQLSREIGSDQLLPGTKNERFQWSKQEFTDIRSQERSVHRQQEQEAQLQIEGIRGELLKLAQTTEELAKEVKIAAIQAPVAPGVYHLNFLDRLRAFIIFMRKNIAESRHWLAMCNQRSKKKSHYWQQVKKSGSKFMLSQERYMATQAG
ncbi:MAG: hypothetical protein JW991_03330 [Candidatus Pacebacteria bacterium]|nr:hypothetical protein [Candidatus Paceibacterota bacterium]